MIIPGGNKANKSQDAAVRGAKTTYAKDAAEGTKVATTNTQTKAVEEKVSPSYARYAEAEQALAAAGGGATSADSVVQNKGLPKWRKQGKSKLALIIAGVLGVAAIFGGIFWGVNANRAAKAEQLATEYYSNSQQIVIQADEDISKAQNNFDTALSYVDEITGDNVTVSLNISTMSNDAVNDVINSMQDNLQSAETSLTEAKTTYSTMTTIDGQDAIEVLNKEYEAKNWERVNEIGAAIAENAAKISSLTGDVNTKTNSIFEAYQNLQSEATKTAQEIADNYYNVTIPNLGTIVRSDINSIEQSVNISAGYVAGINATTASQEIKDKIAAAHQVAVANQALADSEFENYMALYDLLQQNYNAGNYTAVSQIGEQMIDSATLINSYAAIVNENATAAAGYYTEYQETANEAYTQAVFEVEFTENDLNNPEIVKNLISADKDGSILDVKQCVYNSNNGEVSMLLDCLDRANKPYTRLITATIANGLNRDQLTASELINRINQSGSQRLVFDTAMESVAGAGAVGTMNVGRENEVSGNINVSYSVTSQYNVNTGKTTINAQAIAILTDAEGNITYKVYYLSPVVRTGNIKVTTELREEFSTKLAQRISADTSLEIVEENSLEQ